MSEEWKKVIMTEDWDSKHIIGNAKERYDQIKHHGLTHSLKGEEYDWQSFYNGWIEGRLAMLVEFTQDHWREQQDKKK